MLKEEMFINEELFNFFYNSTFPNKFRRKYKDGTVSHKQTCECGKTLVNLYKRGMEWKCKKCWDGGDKNV